MATRTRAPLDSGLLNAPGGTLFKQLADGRWACFFMFGGKKGRILPSEATGRLIARVSSASLLLGWVGLFVVGPLTTDAVAFGVFVAPSLIAGIWLRRHYGRLPKTDETLSRAEHLYQARSFAWFGFAMAILLSFKAGVSYAENHYEMVGNAVMLLAAGITIAGISYYHLNMIIRAAHRRASNPPEMA